MSTLKSLDLAVKSGRPEKQRTDCIIVGVFESKRLSAEAEALDKVSQHYISQIIRRGDCSGKLEQTLLLQHVPHIPATRILLVGCGKERDFDEAAFIKAMKSALTALHHTGASDAICCLTELVVKGRDLNWVLRQAALIAQNSLYRFDAFKSTTDARRRSLKKMVFTLPNRKNIGAAEQSLQEGLAISHGMTLAKNLGNTPSNVCTPSYLADQATLLAENHSRLSVQILEEKELKTLGMGSFLSVAQASANPPKLIVLHYKGARKDTPPIVLVGKGITFDTGGYSLKQPANMIGMKYDMCGAASVLGALQAIASLELPLNVIGVIPTCDNIVGPNATKPGDIVTTMAGKTVEILNTDAEGRLILCDALTYCERFHPDVVIDIATLTGACVATLGHVASGLLGNHNPLINDLLQAGQLAHDKAWQLPLWDEYQPLIRSPHADMANIGGPLAGTITAACFLSRFTEKFHWAHLDVAGTACEYTGDKQGATGRPIPLLVHYLLSRVSQTTDR